MVIAPEEDEDHALLLLKNIAVTGAREREREIVRSCILILSKSQVTRIVCIPICPMHVHAGTLAPFV